MKIFIGIILIFTQTLFADTSEFYASLKDELLKECKNNKEYGKLKYSVKCDLDYHHYNPDKTVKSKQRYNREKAIAKGQVRISEFNVLHPGMGKTRFKDYKKVAQIINRFDIVGVTELIPLINDDKDNNQNVINFIKETPKELAEIKKQIRSLKLSIANSRRSTVTKRRELYLLERKQEKLLADLPDAHKVYRLPGYLLILEELQKLYKGSDWSLILSPQGEGSEATSSPELVGYYYRSSIVAPRVNKYCKSRKAGKSSPVACIINMDKKDMGEDKRDIISRRPFLAEFISGNFSFTLLTSHILFEEPKDEDLQRRILDKAFGVDDYTVLGTGATKEKYARFAEVKMALQFIEKNLKGRGHQKDIIYMGDLNLEMDNPFWETILPEWRNSQLYIEQETSLKKQRYNSDGSESYGKSSNYDHFLFDPSETDECINPQTNTIDGGIEDFVKGKYSGYINRMYKVRNEQSPSRLESFFNNYDYDVNQSKYNKLVTKYIEPKLNDDPIYTVGKVKYTYGTKSISFQGITEDIKASEEFAEKFKDQVLDSQMFDDTYYSYFVSLVSDHYPIYMNCSTN